MTVLAVVLLAAPISVAAPGLKGVGVKPELVAFFSDHLAQQLGIAGLKVTTATQLEAMLGLERQRQLLACSGESSCIAELANGLGVEALLVGSVARVGDGFQANVSLIAANDGRALSLRSLKARSDAALLEQFNDAAPEMASELRARLHSPATAPVEATASQGPRSTRLWALVPAGVAVIGVGAGIALALSSQRQHTRLNGSDQASGISTLGYDEAVAARADGERMQAIAIAAFGVAALGAGLAAWLFFRSDGSPSAALVPLDRGAALTLSGAWP